MHAHTYRALRGVEVNEANLGFDDICDAVLGEGHFLGGDQTLAAMERDYFYPPSPTGTTPTSGARAAPRQRGSGREIRRNRSSTATSLPICPLSRTPKSAPGSTSFYEPQSGSPSSMVNSSRRNGTCASTGSSTRSLIRGRTVVSEQGREALRPAGHRHQRDFLANLARGRGAPTAPATATAPG